MRNENPRNWQEICSRNRHVPVVLKPVLQQTSGFYCVTVFVDFFGSPTERQGNFKARQHMEAMALELIRVLPKRWRL